MKIDSLNDKKINIINGLILTALLLMSTNLWAQTQVLASIRPLALLTEALILEGDSVQQLLPAVASPHHYALKISDRQRIAKADLVLWVGPELESFLQKALSTHSRVLTLAELNTLNWGPMPQIDSTHHHHGHQHESDRDPHLWLNPLNLAALAEAITEELIKLSPSRAQAYETRLQSVLNRLAQVDRDLMKQLAAVKTQPFIVLHPAYSHFVKHYGLNQLDYVVKIPESNLSAKHRYQLQQLEQVVCIFGEEGQKLKRIDQLAKQLKARSMILDPLGVNVEESSGVEALLLKMGKDFHDCLSQ